MDFNTNGPHLAPHPHQYPPQQGSPSPAYSQYSTAIDPHLASTPAAQRHFPHNNMAGSSPGFNASPRYSASPGHQQQSNFVPSDRSLPATDTISADNLDEIYAAFILYCNPYFPSSHDTTELKKIFKKPPMSDNKTFDPYNLFELLKKLEKGEIKTWIQLALDLGVEPPDIEKGQSTQKVQQYAVRLKRWMRAMHIDAFFDFLQGKPHSYYANIPPLNEPFPPGGRDGVPLEEDLAIRGLDPAFKPKRGRKKADELEDDDHGTPPPKRPHLDTSFAFNSGNHPPSAYPNSALPMSAHPDNFVGHDPWTAASMGTPNTNQRGLTPNSALNAAGAPHLRWQVNSHENPSTPHPLSAVPQHTGGPVHLVTPTVLVNGESNSPDKQPSSAEVATELPKVTREMLKRLLAADLLRADVNGRKRLRGHEAKDLADALLTQLSSQNEPSGTGDDASNQGLANWLGFSTHLGLGPTPVPSGIKKIDVQKYRVSDDGYESPIDPDDDSALALGDGSKIKETFDVSWALTLGGCTGKFAVKGLMIDSKGCGEKEEKEGGEGLQSKQKEKSLEERVKELEGQLKGKDREVQLWRQRVLEAVL
ncbi:ARS-binding protein 2 [Lasiodiplodia theobromae]|uniref:ARS-binding protein 2 n=1 Tax=Lasiodiplodia theobromae TaxID=45133 RepID=A0A5N5DP77_9PEZI|nr:ARS-binding protein 2 [Lasiodiplodia theobromae]